MRQKGPWHIPCLENLVDTLAVDANGTLLPTDRDVGVGEAA